MTDEDEKAKESIETSLKVFEKLKHVDTWKFNVFDLTKESKNEPLKFITHHLFTQYDIIQKFKISPRILNNFLTEIERGYTKNNNPYHNNTHAADVVAIMNVILRETRLIEWLTDIEIFGCLLAAIIHDYDHSGTTNGFHIATGSDKALIYNDRSVQENHHISSVFALMKDEDLNILKSLSRKDYHYMRGMLVDLILATDIAFHFQLLNDVRIQMSFPGRTVSKSRACALTLHAADISNPIKKYPSNVYWTNLVMQEFFAQGDKERKLHLPISVLCDRHTTHIPESQLNFMDYVVKPTFDLLVEMAYFIYREVKGSEEEWVIRTPWFECFAENSRKWKEQIANDNQLASILQRLA